MKRFRLCLTFGMAAALLLVTVSSAFAQLEEPEVREIDRPRTLYGEDIRNGLGVNIVINNFGYGLKGIYSRIVAPYTEVYFSTGITGLRNVSEQSFQDFFTGQQIIPNKYNRAIGFPFQLGIKQRIFARSVEDNFRVFVSANGGPALAFIYPYFDDINENGFRDVVLDEFDQPQVEPVNDFFTGWSEGGSQWGITGELKIGIDFGSGFTSLTRVEFGYFFYWFRDGIQMMEPFRPEFNNQGEIIGREPFYEPQEFFGTPQISLTFGKLW